MDMRNNGSKVWLVVVILAVLATLGWMACKKPSASSAEEGADPRVTLAATSSEAPASAAMAAVNGGGFKLVKAEAIQEGVVYADGNGNTFQQERAGDRLCRFHVNGQLRKEVFVHGSDPANAKSMCDIHGELFKQSLTANPAPQKKK